MGLLLTVIGIASDIYTLAAGDDKEAKEKPAVVAEQVVPSSSSPIVMGSGDARCAWDVKGNTLVKLGKLPELEVDALKEAHAKYMEAGILSVRFTTDGNSCVMQVHELRILPQGAYKGFLPEGSILTKPLLDKALKNMSEFAMEKGEKIKIGYGEPDLVTQTIPVITMGLPDPDADKRKAEKEKASKKEEAVATATTSVPVASPKEEGCQAWTVKGNSLLPRVPDFLGNKELEHVKLLNQSYADAGYLSVRVKAFPKQCYLQAYELKIKPEGKYKGFVPEGTVLTKSILERAGKEIEIWAKEKGELPKITFGEPDYEKLEMPVYLYGEKR